MNESVAEPAPAEMESSEELENEDILELDPFGRAIVPEGIAAWEPEDLAPLLEAVCFSLNRTVTMAEVAAILGISPVLAMRTVEVLGLQLRERGLMLQRQHDQLQLVTRPIAAWAVQRALNPEKPTRLSKAALETLAIVAYRQPVTRGVIESIRGVSCDAVLDGLERRGLIAEVGRQESAGQPRLFGTTLRFLQIVGLERIEDLPPLPAGVEIPNVEGEMWETTSVALDVS